eukprot:TRINITY_DN862_c0_g2_i1.p1 TRINITY_DN862_c0_g2~~TRINITY_DN862_c0_g2_i1.p1  ORF type:complete len:160 (-),score=12.89 TRINITY_DN862_c0_g2_i1:79-558(-)
MMPCGTGCQITTISRDWVSLDFLPAMSYSADIQVQGHPQIVSTRVSVRERVNMPNQSNILVLGQFSFISGMVAEWRGSHCQHPSSEIILRSFTEIQCWEVTHSSLPNKKHFIKTSLDILVFRLMFSMPLPQSTFAWLQKNKICSSLDSIKDTLWQSKLN